MRYNDFLPNENPYSDLSAVRDIDMFFGRNQVLHKLFASIAKQQSFSLTGSLHSGKSSILQHACKPEIQQRFHYDWTQHIFVCIDLREYRTEAQFFESVNQHILDRCRKLHDLSLPTKIDDDQSRIFSSILEQIQTHGFRLVLLMDAFDTITRNQKFEPDFFGFLRALATDGKISYVTASLHPLYDDCHEAIQSSPFFNIFQTHQLEPLEQAEAHGLIVEPALRVGVQFTEEEIQCVMDQAGRHPFFLQCVCRYLFEDKHASPAIDLAHIRSKAYKYLLPHFRSIWEHLSEQERKQLLHNKAQVPSAHIQEMPELTESALFHEFLHFDSQASTFGITVKHIELALDKMHDNQVLDALPLRNLLLVKQRLPGDVQTIAIAERVRPIREVLREAFQRMQGDGNPSDTAPDWVPYNLLYYRYFNKKRLTNDQIARRIVCSERQYYRARIKAISMLFREIVDMEALLHNGDNN